MTFESRTWRLIRGIDIPLGASITARFSGGTVTGSTGANRYRADYELRGARLRMAPAVTTGIGGDARSDRTERAFLTLLAAVAGFRLDPTDHALVLVDQTGDDALTFEVVPDVAEDLVGRWMVRLARRDAELRPSAPGAALLTFDRSGEVAASIGVNLAQGTARTDAGRLYLRSLAVGGTAGTPEERDEVAATLAVLEDVHGYRTDGRELTLLDADDATLVVLDRA